MSVRDNSLSNKYSFMTFTDFIYQINVYYFFIVIPLKLVVCFISFNSE